VSKGRYLNVILMSAAGVGVSCVALTWIYEIRVGIELESAAFFSQ
jgi:hypothetical protein